MRRRLTTTMSIGLIITLWGCSDNNTPVSSTDGTAGSSGSATAGASSIGGTTANSGGSSSAGTSGSTATAGSDTGGGSSAAGSPDTSAGGDGSAGASAGSGGETSAGTGGVAGSDSGGSGGNSGGSAGAAGSGGSTGGSSGASGSAGTGGTAGSGGSTSSATPNAASAVTVDTTTSPFAVAVTWTDNSDDETGFNVYFSTDDTMPSTPTTTTVANATSYQLTQVQGGQTYRVWVEAVNDAGKSAATETIATQATTDLVWDDLWYDEAGTVHLAIEDTYDFLGDNVDATGLYAYQSATLDNMGSAQAIDPTLLLDVSANSIDITLPHYFWTEARSSSGSLFSLRELAPAGNVANLAANPGASSVALSWDSTASAAGYEIFYSSTGDLGSATRASDVSTNAATVSGLDATTPYSFWVRAQSSGIAGNGFPGAFATVQTTTTQ